MLWMISPRDSLLIELLLLMGNGKVGRFFRGVSLNPLLILYRYIFPVLNVFTQNYWTGYITPINHQVQLQMVYDAAQSVVQ